MTQVFGLGFQNEPFRLDKPERDKCEIGKLFFEHS
jgi:hypothetical protein